mmetsp:Transcript_10637/g.7947  ORF Transcript_10637/g.7947 Transcript_10637/m.7947 type:complete len:92 (-) Transcript_10637:858-1133(-)
MMQVWIGNPVTMLWLMYGVMPILDYLSPTDKKNVLRDERDKYEWNPAYIVPLYLMMLLDFLAYIFMFWKVLMDEEVSKSTALTILWIMSMT